MDTAPLSKRKLYVVVREDLSPGRRIAQAGHAVAEVIQHHPVQADHWNVTDNYLIVLGVPDWEALVREFMFVRNAGVLVTPFYEPDLDGQMTAFAALPHPRDNDRFSHLPLAARQRRLGRAWGRLRGRLG